jgi:hypothetical protein
MHGLILYYKFIPRLEKAYSPNVKKSMHEIFADIAEFAK